MVRDPTLHGQTLIPMGEWSMRDKLRQEPRTGANTEEGSREDCLRGPTAIRGLVAKDRHRVPNEFQPHSQGLFRVGSGLGESEGDRD